MKKLGRKGFTLIELLAVIVILSIVLVVTIPSVINAMNSAKKKQFENAIKIVANWLTEQYNVANLNLDASSVEPAYNNFIAKMGDYEKDYISSLKNNKNLSSCGNSTNYCLNESIEMIETAGISNPEKNIDLENTYVWFDNNKVGIKATAKSGGSFDYNESDSFVFVNGGEDQAYSDENIFDMSLFTSKLSKNDDGYWYGPFSDLYNDYRYKDCGFLGNSDYFTDDSCKSFKGEKLHLEENTSYQISLEGYISEVGGNFRIRVQYTDGTYENIISLNSNTNTIVNNETKNNATIKFFYITYSNNVNIYLKNMTIKKVG